MLPEAQVGLARQLQTALLDAVPEFVPVVKWGNLLFTLGGAHVLAIASHRSHLNLQVFNGAALEARFPRLEGGGKGLRQIKLRHGQPVDAELVQAIARASAEALA